MTLFEAVLLAIVEGVTEFLPVSSTGHMIITSSLLGIADDDFTKTFTIAIQLGAILSVVTLYFKRFIQSFHFYFILFVGFIPAMVLGFFLGDAIDALLENVVVVAISLLLGGIVLLFVDKWFGSDTPTDKETITYRTAFTVGLFQCLALIPGVSRSAATIIGGLTQKLTRKAAAEFSFFLAVPTMFAATVYSLFVKENAAGEKAYTLIWANQENIIAFITGNIVAFIIAMFAMRSFVSYLTKKGFRIFGWYRIIVGTVILILLALDINLQVV
ncbi:MAG: undecaprenyl-diphosphate phosphatase [Chitinophagales bacterium]